MTDETISATCANCAIGRRDFVIRSAMVAAAAALAACGATDSTSPGLSGTAEINVNDYTALSSVGGIAVLTLQGEPIAVVRTDNTSFLALSRVCPHQGGTIGRSGSGFRCPEHGATFSSTGIWTGGQRTTNMHSYATSYDSATGLLTIS
jgi:Rieske Fe-S protein